jgi:hypothetical protein
MAQERAQWMTLREALAQIEKAEHCSLKAAWTLFGEACSDDQLDVRWSHCIHLTRGDWDDEDIGPPRTMRFWRLARRILIRGGEILDDPVSRKNSVRLQLIRQNKLRYRPVLIRRADVERIWRTEKGREQERADIRRKEGRPSVKYKVWKTLQEMRDESHPLGAPQKHLATLVAKRNGRNLGDKGWNERTIIQHVSTWLRDKGLSPSNSESESH